MQITHEQFMEVAIAGFGKEEWKYDTRNLFQVIDSMIKNVHKLYLNGKILLSIYSYGDNYLTFEVPNGEFNHLAAMKKMIELNLIKM